MSNTSPQVADHASPIDPIYEPQSLEANLQAQWADQQAFKVTEDLSKEKFYCLSMFPYPSGQLHMGHVRNYTIGDVIARYQRMMNKNVLQPMGWDAFGLPAENAAIKNQVPPAKWTYENIANMRTQLQRLGFGYDWSREIATCKPDYYRWEQWLFTRMYEKGLVYRKNAVVNWDPVDQTVLANEQVVDGRGWRSGALVERRSISQWFLKITAYAEELLKDMDKLGGWPEQVLTMQENWIGKSKGAEIEFKVADRCETLTVFTTRPDTLFGATYMAIAPEHPLAQKMAEKNPELGEFIQACSHTKQAEAELATAEKKGMDTGLKAINPISGKTIPIWVANFVLIEYGTGAVMSVPAHDERDHEFATKYGLPIQQVLKPVDDTDIDVQQTAFTDHGITVNSGSFDGLTFDQAFNAITDALAKQNQGKVTINYRLRDWGISRQRYWGTPIPMLYCDTCGIVPVPESDLPVVLPETVTISGQGSPLTALDEFTDTTCPTCNGKAKRETDTFDTFMESSWYYARYACKNQESAMLDDRANYWTPVDQYIGGIEHAVMHLLYARFIHKVLRDEGLLNSDEPFTNLLTQGMVLKDGAKMSKSKGNVVDPNALIDEYGADTVRLFAMFASPPEQSLEWSDSGVDGCARFMKRVWTLCVEHGDVVKAMNLNLTDPLAPRFNWEGATDEQLQLRREIHQILKQVRYDFERYQFNTVVSGAMKIANLLVKVDANETAYTNSGNGSAEHQINAQLIQEGLSILLRALNPITPHMAEHLWVNLSFGESLLCAPMPKVASEALKTDTISLVIQVNGKVRAQINVPAEADTTTIETLAKENPNIQKYLEQATLKKCIVVPGKLVNLVAVPKS